MNKLDFINSHCIRFKLFCTALTMLFISSCTPLEQTTALEKIQMRGTIVMGTINSPLTYSYDGDNHSGLDYELALKLAQYLQVELIVKEFDDLESLFLSLDNKKIDFAGAGLTLTPNRAKKYRSPPPYYYLSEQVVYRQGTRKPRSLSDIKVPISVLKSSSHEESIIAHKSEFTDLIIDVVNDIDQEYLLQNIANKNITFAIVDSTTLAQKQRYYPTLRGAFTLTNKRPVAWLILKDKDHSLFSGMIEFMGEQYRSGMMTKIEEKYFGHVAHFDYVDTRTFLRRIHSVLPQYETLFKKYETPEVSWKLLAAVSYQESHWDPLARSPTGVRGMMMLTNDTAQFVGIENRLDPDQSVKGGAKYLTQLTKRLPKSIPEDEKIWFALAAYNIGLGHLLDARRLTEMNDKNPDSWTDVKDILPLLHQSEWYKKTRYGYARGKEAQHYVNNIRQYLKTLDWYVQQKESLALLEKQNKVAEMLAKARQKSIEQSLHSTDSKEQEGPHKPAENENIAEEASKADITRSSEDKEVMEVPLMLQPLMKDTGMVTNREQANNK